MCKKVKNISIQSTVRWIDLVKAPKNISFRCLIKFKETGFDGNHISSGYYWHRDECFSVDNNEMKDFTPIQFIPMYSNI
jgi:hypothetical protein